MMCVCDVRVCDVCVFDVCACDVCVFDVSDVCVSTEGNSNRSLPDVKH